VLHPSKLSCKIGIIYVNPELEKFENFTDKGKKRIADICKIAARVFDEKGYLVATMEDVARASGVTKGGIFHYFSRKEELLFLILYRYVGSSLRILKKKLEPCETAQERIYVFIQHHLGNYEENQAESRLALRERTNLSANCLLRIKALEREYREILKSLVQSLMKGKKWQEEMLATYTLLGMVSFPYAWFDPKRKKTSKDLGDLIYQIYVGGLENPKELAED
jgi:TetR/AcrR family transcriptional regulator, cholesterol catabolism regulator